MPLINDNAVPKWMDWSKPPLAFDRILEPQTQGTEKDTFVDRNNTFSLGEPIFVDLSGGCGINCDHPFNVLTTPAEDERWGNLFGEKDGGDGEEVQVIGPESNAIQGSTIQSDIDIILAFGDVNLSDSPINKTYNTTHNMTHSTMQEVSGTHENNTQSFVFPPSPKALATPTEETEEEYIDPYKRAAEEEGCYYNFSSGGRYELCQIEYRPPQDHVKVQYTYARGQNQVRLHRLPPAKPSSPSDECFPKVHDGCILAMTQYGVQIYPPEVSPYGRQITPAAKAPAIEANTTMPNQPDPLLSQDEKQPNAPAGAKLHDISISNAEPVQHDHFQPPDTQQKQQKAMLLPQQQQIKQHYQQQEKKMLEKQTKALLETGHCIDPIRKAMHKANEEVYQQMRERLRGMPHTNCSRQAHRSRSQCQAIASINVNASIKTAIALNERNKERLRLPLIDYSIDSESQINTATTGNFSFKDSTSSSIPPAVKRILQEMERQKKLQDRGQAQAQSRAAGGTAHTSSKFGNAATKTTGSFPPTTAISVPPAPSTPSAQQATATPTPEKPTQAPRVSFNDSGIPYEPRSATRCRDIKSAIPLWVRCDGTRVVHPKLVTNDNSETAAALEKESVGMRVDADTNINTDTNTMIEANEENLDPQSASADATAAIVSVQQYPATEKLGRVPASCAPTVDTRRRDLGAAWFHRQQKQLREKTLNSDRRSNLYNFYEQRREEEPQTQQQETAEVKTAAGQQEEERQTKKKEVFSRQSQLEMERYFTPYASSETLFPQAPSYPALTPRTTTAATKLSSTAVREKGFIDKQGEWYTYDNKIKSGAVAAEEDKDIWKVKVPSHQDRAVKMLLDEWMRGQSKEDKNEDEWMRGQSEEEEGEDEEEEDKEDVEEEGNNNDEEIDDSIINVDGDEEQKDLEDWELV